MRFLRDQLSALFPVPFSGPFRGPFLTFLSTVARTVHVVLRAAAARQQSYECVTAVTERLQKMGIAGHQTTAGAERQVDRARSIMEALKSKVTILKGDRFSEHRFFYVIEGVVGRDGVSAALVL